MRSSLPRENRRLGACKRWTSRTASPWRRCACIRSLPALTRTVTNAFDFEGYAIPAGTRVIIGSAVPHRLPDCFPDPERFDIERYTAASGGTPRARGVRPLWPGNTPLPGQRVCGNADRAHDGDHPARRRAGARSARLPLDSRARTHSPTRPTRSGSVTIRQAGSDLVAGTSDRG